MSTYERIFFKNFDRSFMKKATLSSCQKIDHAASFSYNRGENSKICLTVKVTKMANREIELNLRPLEFFRTELKKSLKQTKTHLDPESETYLVNFLADKAYPRGHEDGYSHVLEVLEKPLALIYKKASEAEGAQKISLMQAVGDTSLFISGFFTEFFNQKSFSRSYYMDLGSTSYNIAANHIAGHHPNHYLLMGIFTFLSNHFYRVAEIISDLADRLRTSDYEDIYAVHKLWEKKQSEQLLKALKKQGIIPIHTKKP